MTAPAVAPPIRRSSVPLDDDWRFVADPHNRLDPASLPDGALIKVPGSMVGRPCRTWAGYAPFEMAVDADVADGREHDLVIRRPESAWSKRDVLLHALAKKGRPTLQEESR